MLKSYVKNNLSDSTRIYDLNLLKQLINVQSKYSTFINKNTADKDIEIRNTIKSLISEIMKKSESSMKIEEDSYGNIYVTKGEAKSYPCVVSHVDTVHSIVKGRRVYQQNDILFCFSDDLKQQVGTGGDDRVGVFVNLQALLDFDNIKAVFYRNEEIGHLGSKFSIANNKKFYNNCNFILQCDRKGNDDFLATSAGIKLCSKDFENSVKAYTEKHGFKIRDIGISTDVDTLVKEKVGVSCANISSGYYSPHSDKEVINIKDVGRTYSLVYDIIDNIGNVKFPHTYIPPKPSTKYSHTSSKASNTNSSNSNNLNLFKPLVKEAYVWEQVGKNTKTLNKVHFEGAYNIINPRYLVTDYKCDKCSTNLVVDTDKNDLKCMKCSKYITAYPEWAKDTVVTLTEEGRKNKYVYSWYHGVWIREENSVFVTNNNLNFWTTKKDYEEKWKK